MATIREQLQGLDSGTESSFIRDQIEEDDVSNIGSFMAGLGSGLFKIPEGVFSLGATLLDLGADTDTATEVEEYFAKINPFDEYAEATAAGRLSELLVNLAVPAGYASKTAGKLIGTALDAKKGGKYLKFGAQAGAAGLADAVAVANVEEAGTLGDLVGGITAIDRESNNPQTELLNRLKFGTEGALFTAGLSGLFQGAKKLAKEGENLRFSNSKFDRALNKFALNSSLKKPTASSLVSVNKGLNPAATLSSDFLIKLSNI